MRIGLALRYAQRARCSTAVRRPDWVLFLLAELFSPSITSTCSAAMRLGLAFFGFELFQMARTGHFHAAEFIAPEAKRLLGHIALPKSDQPVN